MKKFLFIFVCFILFGCTNPKFHTNTQKVSFKHPSDVMLNIEGYESNSSEMQVKRSFSSLKGTLSKTGFEDKQIEIKSHFTDDKWAESCGDGCVDSSAFVLLPPVYTLGSTIAGGYAGAIGAPNILGTDSWGYVFSPFTMVLGAGEGFLWGITNDIYNLFTLAFPRAVFGNPWYEYDKEIDLTKEILVPTPEFEKECHSKKNTFIGNNDCLTCLTEKMVISTEEECNRCSNRGWSNFECLLK